MLEDKRRDFHDSGKRYSGLISVDWTNGDSDGFGGTVESSYNINICPIGSKVWYDVDKQGCVFAPNQVWVVPSSSIPFVNEPTHSVPEGFASQVLKIVRDRGNVYGSPSQNHQLTADILSVYFSRRFGTTLTFSAEDVCMFNILQKASRLAFTSKDDSVLDIAGYVENIAMLKPEQRNKK